MTAGAVNSHLAQMGKLPVSQEDEDRLAAFCGMAWTEEVVAAYKSIESAFAL